MGVEMFRRSFARPRRHTPRDRAAEPGEPREPPHGPDRSRRDVWPLAAIVVGLTVTAVWILLAGWLGLRVLLWLFGE